MSMKIKVSYTEESDANTILSLLKPVISQFKVKKNTNNPPYKHLYFIPKNGEKP